MQTDTIQIGTLVVSKYVIDVLAPILQTILGALIAYISIKAANSQRWQQEKHDKLQEQRRKALEIALDWIEPLRPAISKLEVYQPALTLMAELNKIQLTPKDRILLPQGIYPRTLKLAADIQSFNPLPVPSGPPTTGSRRSRNAQKANRRV